MIDPLRVHLDGLIHRWEERISRMDIQHWSVTIRTLRQCVDELRAVLLVLGDARPHQEQERHDSD